MSEIGVINHADRARQLMLFKGIVRHRRISPTDLDGLIDYNGEAFIILEGKVKGTKLQTGQRKAIENLCKALSKFSIALVFEHKTPTTEDVIVKDCIVTKVYEDDNWRVPETKRTVLEAIEIIEKHLRISKVDI